MLNIAVKKSVKPIASMDTSCIGAIYFLFAKKMLLLLHIFS